MSVFREYLTNPEEYLNTQVSQKHRGLMVCHKKTREKQVRPMGYKTCHALNSSLDSTICAKDCDRLKKHKFAKDCKNRGGLYKCCIRRDAAFCHECRYQAQISGVRY